MRFQLVMLFYNLNCLLLLFNRDDGVKADDLKHATTATARHFHRARWMARYLLGGVREAELARSAATRIES